MLNGNINENLCASVSDFNINNINSAILDVSLKEDALPRGVVDRSRRRRKDVIVDSEGNRIPSKQHYCTNERA